MTIVAIIIAFLLDIIIGDPYHWPHPVKWIGNYISWFLKISQKWTLNRFFVGGLLWSSTILLTLGATHFVLAVSLYFHEVLYWLVFIYLAYTTLAIRSLAFEAIKVYNTLKNGTLEEARYQVSMIVGRQTDQLTPEEIAKATIETVAENTSDGVIGPMLCLLIFGPVGAMVYKSINTLDSMVGYKTEKYYKIGFVSAKLDDLANLIPARLTFLLLVLSAHVLQYDVKETFRIGFRDRYQHASPNSAFSEAVVSGALGIQLGGAHVYHGELVDKPTIGENKRNVEPDDIVKTVQLLYMCATLMLCVTSVIEITRQFIMR